MRDKTISNITEYIGICNDLINSGFFAFRGQCCSLWSLEPGIMRKVRRTFAGIGEGGLLFRLSVDHALELVRKAKVSGHFAENEPDLSILASLQHYGAATPLLDFSYDPLVALYFACLPHDESAVESDGKVFCINYPHQMRSHSSPLRPINDPSRINLDSTLEDASRYIWYWKTPEYLCRRSERQQSVFIFGWGLYWKYDTNKLIDELNVLVISAETKKSILNELNLSHGISEQTLFPDVYGFSHSNSHDKMIKHYSSEELYDKGEEQWRDGSPEWAAEYYKMAYTKNPNWIEARCKSALSLNCIGEQDKALTLINASMDTLGRNWKLLLCRSIIDCTGDKDWRVDMREAKAVADTENERSEFEAYLYEYGALLCVKTGITSR
ncbi:FRG domain-containing protein [Desulfonatronum thiosulfatophilum]|uniref:FRG domain-containing protein n=1 Tax=Desulfonatronum thiosulfatophilum TaxID=617002 RepID=A0A1G6E6T9_9BACT|nr:FRG domain-containing protein [Desulfonatronum thiosulfatophilum]SDB53082.1 FRG domain-containing protein [Desulfonatronum thiosulfatophilum]